MDFINTKYGHAICELGQKALNRYLKDTSQYVLRVKTNAIEETITKEIQAKSKYISYIPVTNNPEEIVLVFEK